MDPKTNKRYLLITLLFFHTVHTYMDRICISAASDYIKSDLGVTDQMMGYIFGIFALGYALFQIPSGWLADHFGPKKALTWVVVAWSTFTSLTGAAWNALSLLVIRFLFGVGEAGAFPGATRAFYNWVPAKERGMANGIFHSGARMGAAVSLFFLPFLIRWVGWRATFLINGLLGIIWVTIWLMWFRDHPRQHKKVSASEVEYIESGIAEEKNDQSGTPLAAILTSSSMLLVMFQYIASNITFFISFTWLLPYLVSQWGSHAEIYAPIPLIFGMFAQWTAGWLTTWIYKRGYPVMSRKIPALAGFTIAVIGLLTITQMQELSPLSFVMLFSVAVFGVEMTISPSWSLCMDIGGEKSGTVSATMNMVGNIGSAFSAIIFPFFVASITIPLFATTTGTANSFFVFAAAMNILAIAAWIFINPKRKIREVSKRQLTLRFIIMIALLFVIVLGALLYKFLS